MKHKEENLVKILKDFNTRLVGDEETKKIICETLLVFPKEVIDFVVKNVWFVSAFDDAWSFTLDSEELCGRTIVFLSDDLLRHSKERVTYSVAHEIAHIMLGHKNPYNAKLPQTTEKKFETGADEFAKYYLDLSKIS